VQPLVQAKGKRNIEQAVQEPVGGVKSRHVAFSYKGYPQAELVTPVGKFSLAQVPRQFKLNRLIHHVGITAYWLDPG
jgi:hypothetical protein